MGSLRFVAIALLLGSPAFAQSPTYGVGRTPTAEEIRRMDISIGPTGEELPPGRGSAKEGLQVYTQKACIACHGAGEREPCSRRSGAWRAAVAPDIDAYGDLLRETMQQRAQPREDTHLRDQTHPAQHQPGDHLTSGPQQPPGLGLLHPPVLHRPPPWSP